ncbi:hypothetical protein Tco_0378018 [Tanacetum coccineum]
MTVQRASDLYALNLKTVLTPLLEGNSRIDGQGGQVGGQGTEIMPPRMTTRSAGRATAAPRGRRMGGQTSRGGGRTRGRSGNQGNGRIDGQCGEVGGQGTKIMLPRMTTQSAGLATTAPQGGKTGGRTSRGCGRTRGRSGDQVPGFSTIIAQQLLNLLPTILSQSRRPRNVIENNNHRGCTYKEFLAYNPKEYDGKEDAIVYTSWIEKMESV